VPGAALGKLYLSVFVVGKVFGEIYALFCVVGSVFDEIWNDNRSGKFCNFA